MPDKKCPQCKRWNSESAMVCECGYDFVNRKSTTSVQVASSIKVPGTVNPIVVAAINGFPLILGIGYIFLDDVKRFLFVFLVLEIGIPKLLFLTGLDRRIPYFLAPLWIAVIIDGYLQAKAYNKRKLEALIESQKVKQELANSK